MARIPDIPVALSALFDKIRANNTFTLLANGGDAVWVSDWHDEELQPFDLARISWATGSGFLIADGGTWRVEVIDGESPFEDGDDATSVELQFQHPFYFFGDIPSVVDRVNGEYGAIKNSAFPLALLLTLDKPYAQQRKGWADYELHLYLCVKSEPETKADERYPESYDEMLLPLWDVIRRYLIRDAHILNNETVTFRERWGDDGLYGRANNTFNVMVDALECKCKITFNTESICQSLA